MRVVERDTYALSAPVLQKSPFTSSLQSVQIAAYLSLRANAKATVVVTRPIATAVVVRIRRVAVAVTRRPPATAHRRRVAPIATNRLLKLRLSVVRQRDRPLPVVRNETHVLSFELPDLAVDLRVASHSVRRRVT